MNNDFNNLSILATINDILNTQVLIDTGAAVTAISANLWNKLLAVDESVTLSPCEFAEVKTVSGAQLPVLGH